MVRMMAFLVLAGVAAIVAPFAITPSVNGAAILVQAQAEKHGAGYPAPAPPQRFSQALVATEDHRFYSVFDPGVDPFAVGRAALGQILGWRDQGGSTIEQQLAKMLYTPRDHGTSAKLEQVALAIKLSFTYAKPDILAMYASVVYFGSGYYGLENASCGYFGKPAASLTWAQAAMMVGIIDAPSIYNPRVNPEYASARERHVLARLVTVGDITEAQAKAELAQPIGLIAKASGKNLPCHQASQGGPVK